MMYETSNQNVVEWFYELVHVITLNDSDPMSE